MGAVLAPHTFLCPNGTVFDEDGFMCDWWFNVRCDDGEQVWYCYQATLQRVLVGDTRRDEF